MGEAIIMAMEDTTMETVDTIMATMEDGIMEMATVDTIMATMEDGTMAMVAMEDTMMAMEASIMATMAMVDTIMAMMDTIMAMVASIMGTGGTVEAAMDSTLAGDLSLLMMMMDFDTLNKFS